tara:strand:- start:6022 stop:8061 length:2040 start_codon:yes stop_codon:yes gene_type:complete
MKTYQKDLLFLTFIISVYIFPISIVGAERTEDYLTTHFSLEIIAENFFSPFIFYYDLLGPGSRIPLGIGIDYFYLPIFLIKNLKFFYLFSLILGFYLQLNFFKKIFKILKFNHIYILSFLYAFNITFLANLITGDSIKTFFILSLYPAIFYYLIKFSITESSKYFFKLLFVFSYAFLNSQPTTILIFSILCFLFILFNRKFFFLSKKYFYFGIIIFIFLISEEIFRLIYESSRFLDGERSLLIDVKPKHFTSGIVFIFKFFEDFFNVDFPYLSKTDPSDNRWLPFGGIFFYFAFLWSIGLIILKQSKKIFYLNYIFFISIILILIDTTNFSFSLINNPHVIRDLSNFISIFILGNFLSSIKNKKILDLLIFSIVLITVLHVSSTIKMHFTYEKEKEFNVLKLNKNYKNSSFYKLTKQIDFNQYNPGKTYLSEGIWELVIDKENKSKIFSEANIFHFRDFLDYKMFPFNGHFKNSSKYQLRKAERKMYSIIKPEFEEINNNIFFNLFNIKYLLILESEINKIHSTKFEEISRIKFENDNILLFEIIDERRAIIKKQNINQINKCKNFPMVKCLLNINSLFHLSDNISFKRLGLNKYEIINNSDKSKKIVLPFLYDYGWKSEIGSIQDINKTLFYLEVESNSKDIIYYKDSVRLYLKLLSIFTFFFLILIIATYNKKFTNN